MHPGDGDAVFEAHQLGQHLGALNDRNLARVRLGHLGIGRVDGGAGHHHRGAGDVGRVVALVNGGAQLRQPLSHRAAAQVGARDLHAQVEQNLGNAAHADAADTDEVRVLRGGKHVRMKLHFNIPRCPPPACERRPAINPLFKKLREHIFLAHRNLCLTAV